MMGGKHDLNLYISQKCINDNAYRHNIDTACDHIYSQNYAINSVAVDSILAGKSLVPTKVSTLPVNLVPYMQC